MNTTKVITKPYTLPSQLVKNVTKLTMLHVDGSTSEMKLIAPIYSMWGEAQELSNNYLSEYAERLAEDWINIIGYQVELGSIDSNGNEKYIMKYNKHILKN